MLTVIYRLPAQSALYEVEYQIPVVDTGLVVKVPLFINEGEKIIVTSYDGKYYSRA